MNSGKPDTKEIYLVNVFYTGQVRKGSPGDVLDNIILPLSEVGFTILRSKFINHTTEVQFRLMLQIVPESTMGEYLNAVDEATPEWFRLSKATFYYSAEL